MSLLPTPKVLRKAKMRVPWNYPLFKHLGNEHSLFLTDSEMDEIIRIVKTLKKPKRRNDKQ